MTSGPLLGRRAFLTASGAATASAVLYGAAAHAAPISRRQGPAGYLFAYFTGEAYPNGEQVYFALSQPDDPLHWQELNGGRPALISRLGEQGVRDPFLIRSPDGRRFYLLATDLKMYGDGDWDRAQRFGSRSIMIWESTDLMNWSRQRMVEVAPEEAGNTWAPEASYDPPSGEYIVFWASKLYDDPSHSGRSYQRILYARTADFHTFTDAETYMDYGYSVIDTTMIAHDGRISRFTKDERPNTPSTPNGKFVFQEVGDSVFDSHFSTVAEGIGKGIISRGEGPIVFQANGAEKWYLFLDEFGGRGYVPFETTDPHSGTWTAADDYRMPPRPRHGSVLPLSTDEYHRLRHCQRTSACWTRTE